MGNLKLRCALSLVGLMAIMSLFSQDKHDYITPFGKTLLYREVTDANRTILRMSEISPISTGIDGLVVSFNMRQNLSLVTRPLKLLSFRSMEEADSYLEIYYHNGTITIRRKMNSGSSYYYDYNLYDPMFTVDAGVTQWDAPSFLITSCESGGGFW